MKEINMLEVSRLTSPEFGALAKNGTMVVLLPVGSVEPHGPHMSLVTDTAISQGAAWASAETLVAAGYSPVLAPAVAYGVTDCAAGFPGAISVPGPVLTAMVGAVVDGYLRGGALHVCVINNHLEPAQDAAIRKVLEGRERVSVACPLRRKWARTLGDEFRSGACHAGRYETSIVLACDESLVDAKSRSQLPALSISLSEQLGLGIATFAEMGMSHAYTGNPAGASAEEGRALLERLAEMIVGEVLDGIAGTGK